MCIHISGVCFVCCIHFGSFRSLPQTITANAGSMVQKIVGLFKIISRLDYFIPQADVDAPLETKPRMSITDDGQDKYPSGLFNLGLMKDFPEMGKNLQQCPQPAIDAFREGQLLAWLCQYGIGNAFLKKGVETSEYPFFKLVDPKDDASGCEQSGLVLDFRDLEAYQYKEDYEPYGGVAFFSVNCSCTVKEMKLSWVVTPRTKSKIMVKEKNQAFRRPESMILASLFLCNCWKALGGNSHDVQPSRGCSSQLVRR